MTQFRRRQSRPTPPPDRQRMMTDAIELHRRGRFVEAERIYRRILQAEPSNPDALHLLGLIANQAGQTDAAVELIQKAIAISPTIPSFRSNLATIFEELERYADCEAAARGALGLDPHNGNALRCLGNALRATGRGREAADVYAEAVRIVADDPDLWANYGATLLELGREDEATDSLRNAIARDPGRAELYSRLGRAELAAGRRDAAVDAFQDALRLQPVSAPVRLELAEALLRGGRPREAVRVLKRCLELSPGNREALACLAAAASEAGEMDTRGSLMDFDGLVRQRLCRAPKGYGSLDAFNGALMDQLAAREAPTWETGSKAAVGGVAGEESQTDEGPSAVLAEAVRVAIAEYLAAIPADTDHPFLSTRPGEWRLSFRTGGPEEGHDDPPRHHPDAWLSGVYFAAVPSPAEGQNGDAGWIEFGRPPEHLHLQTPAPTRRIRPFPGLMLLFPAYFGYRMSAPAAAGRSVGIAFDLVPEGASSEAESGEMALSATEAAAEARRVQDRLRSGEVEQAMQQAERLVAAVPEDPAALHVAGLAAFRSGEFERAGEYLAEACRLAPDAVPYRMDFAAWLQRSGRQEEAAENLERAADIDPAGVDALMRLATLHSDHGDFEGARRAYERIIRRQPDHGGAHYGLASLKTFSEDDPQIGQLRALLADPSLRPTNEVVISFALARALDQLDRLDEAMELYQRANRIERELTDFDIATERENTRRIVDAFGPEVFEKFSGAGEASELPVFVVGMPRSGTTLVEQILDSHPRVHGAGELNDLWRTLGSLGRRLPPGSALPEGVRDVDPGAWREFGKRFLGRLRGYDPDADRIVDKLPFNYTLAGIIRIMLPEARIIHCVRDPRDTCVSCYLTSFQNDRGFTCDLAELGETYRLYWDLMEHWRRVLPGGLYEIRYENLVEDLEGEARRLVDYLGLEWSDRCLRFFENPRTVTTASMTQVRQPVYKSSVGRWRRYTDYLGPLLDNLGDLSRYGVEEG